MIEKHIYRTTQLCRTIIQCLATLAAIGFVSPGIAQERETPNGQPEPEVSLSLGGTREVRSELSIVDQVQFSSDNQYLMVEQAGAIAIWDLESGSVETHFLRETPRGFGESSWEDPTALKGTTFQNGTLVYYARADERTQLGTWSKQAGFDTLYRTPRDDDFYIQHSNIFHSGDGTLVALMAWDNRVISQRAFQKTDVGWESAESDYWVPFSPDSERVVPPVGGSKYSGLYLDPVGNRVLRYVVFCQQDLYGSGTVDQTVVELLDRADGNVIWRKEESEFVYPLGFTFDGTGVVMANAQLGSPCNDQDELAGWLDHDGTQAAAIVLDTATGDLRFELTPAAESVGILPCLSDMGVQGFLRVDYTNRLEREPGEDYTLRFERLAAYDGSLLDSGTVVVEYLPRIALECDGTGELWLLSFDITLQEPYSFLWDVSTGESPRLPSVRIDSPSGHHFSFSADSSLLASADEDGMVSLLSITREPFEVNQVAQLAAFDDGNWAVMSPEGHYDASDPADFDRLTWSDPDGGGSVLPLSVFYREYYEPRLLGRLVAGERLDTPQPRAELDRTQPYVHVVDVRPSDDGQTHVLVAARQSDEEGVRDLKLFRDGQLVGSHALGGRVQTIANHDAWVFHDGAMIEVGDFPDGSTLLGQDQSWLVAFHNIEIPASGSISGEVEFSAYAFNRDGIKSETHRVSHRLPATGSQSTRPTAYVIAVGVNAYDNAAWDLQYAAHDARATQEILSRHLEESGQFEDVVPVSLVAERDVSGQITGAAARADLLAVLDVLAGAVGDPLRLAQIPGAAALKRAGPNDLVYLTFSGHGLSGDDGVFHFFMSDIGSGDVRTVDSDLLARTLDSDQLASYVSRVDAGQIVLVVDACNSAASVQTAGFKPGPMGSRGLGQLAYDKAMMVVAASQIENVALESEHLRHGLLTFAILREGLQGGAADIGPVDGAIEMSELLSYAVERVPVLYEELGSGRFVPQGRGLDTSFRPTGHVTDSPQTPSLFNFARGDREVRLPVLATEVVTGRNAAVPSLPRTGNESIPSAEPSREVGETFRDTLRNGELGPEMVVIPEGRFQMGCVSGVGCNDEEHPVHDVAISEAIAVSKYEVTFAAWEACQRAGGCSAWRGIGSRQGRNPVTNVSWEDAQDYVRWLSEQTGAAYRLLTESEWEYAARAGTDTAYSWGKQFVWGSIVIELPGEVDSWEQSEGTVEFRSGDAIVSTWDTSELDMLGDWDFSFEDNSIHITKPSVPVSSLVPNGWGLHDMHGNVEEWVQDCWSDSYDDAPSDGSPWQHDDCSQSVVRGGSVSTLAPEQRATYREMAFRSSTSDDLGFRVARSINR